MVVMGLWTLWLLVYSGLVGGLGLGLGLSSRTHPHAPAHPHPRNTRARIEEERVDDDHAMRSRGVKAMRAAAYYTLVVVVVVAHAELLSGGSLSHACGLDLYTGHTARRLYHTYHRYADWFTSTSTFASTSTSTSTHSGGSGGRCPHHASAAGEELPRGHVRVST